jgi:hypothetical protein
MNFSEKVKCDRCKGVFLRGQTLILATPKGRFRLCRGCYAAYSTAKLDDEYQEAKKATSLYNLKGTTDAYNIIKEKEKFIKDLKEGKWLNTK